MLQNLPFLSLYHSPENTTIVMYQAGMQNEELRGGGKTQTKRGPAGLQLIFPSPMFGNSSCGGRTYPAANGTHNIEISILEPVQVKIIVL